MIKNILVLVIVNVAIFFLCIIPLFYITGYLYGYADSYGNHQAGILALYILFLIIHLAIDVLLLHLFKFMNRNNILVTFIEILILFGIVALRVF
jgi:hypothetical protein